MILSQLLYGLKSTLTTRKPRSHPNFCGVIASFLLLHTILASNSRSTWSVWKLVWMIPFLFFPVLSCFCSCISMPPSPPLLTFGNNSAFPPPVAMRRPNRQWTGHFSSPTLERRLITIFHLFCYVRDPRGQDESVTGGATLPPPIDNCAGPLIRAQFHNSPSTRIATATAS